MRPVGYITDAEGRRVFALVPVAQINPAARRRSAPINTPTDEEKAVLDRLLTRPVACLETSTQVNPIRGTREAAGITQADLAFAMGISQPMLSRQEQPFRGVHPGYSQKGLGDHPAHRGEPEPSSGGLGVRAVQLWGSVSGECRAETTRPSGAAPSARGG